MTRYGLDACLHKKLIRLGSLVIKNYLAQRYIIGLNWKKISQAAEVVLCTTIKPVFRAGNHNLPSFTLEPVSSTTRDKMGETQLTSTRVVPTQRKSSEATQDSAQPCKSK